MFLRETDFVWRVPDSRVPDSIAEFLVPAGSEYQLLQGDTFKAILPAKASVATDSTPAISSTTSDVADASVDATALTITFKLPHLAETKYYDITELVEIIQVTGSTTYTKLTYGTSAGQWSYDASTGTFTVTLSAVASVTLWIYYVPKLGLVKLVHRIPGAVSTNVVLANTTTTQHVSYDPALSPPRIQETEVCSAKTYILLVVYPRYIDGKPAYVFDPLRPDNTISDVCLVELPIHPF